MKLEFQQCCYKDTKLIISVSSQASESGILKSSHEKPAEHNMDNLGQGKGAQYNSNPKTRLIDIQKYEDMKIKFVKADE